MTFLLQICPAALLATGIFGMAIVFRRPQQSLRPICIRSRRRTD